jgi:hypothetical protein
VTPKTAKDFLDSIGGAQGTRDWVEGDRIAKHALWLAQHRQVVPGARFLVEGHVTEMHNLLATQGHVASLVCEALARYLADPNKFSRQPQAKLIVCGNGKLLVNTSAISILAGLYLDESVRLPSSNKIGRALGNLAKDQARVGTTRYWEVNSDLVIGWAERTQIGDPDAMRQRIADPPPVVMDMAAITGKASNTAAMN